MTAVHHRSPRCQYRCHQDRCAGLAGIPRSSAHLLHSYSLPHCHTRGTHPGTASYDTGSLSRDMIPQHTFHQNRPHSHLHCHRPIFCQYKFDYRSGILSADILPHSGPHRCRPYSPGCHHNVAAHLYSCRQHTGTHDLDSWGHSLTHQNYHHILGYHCSERMQERIVGLSHSGKCHRNTLQR